MHTLMVSLHQTEPEHRVLAASLLLQLDMMVHTLFATQIPLIRISIYCINHK